MFLKKVKILQPLDNLFEIGQWPPGHMEVV